ncbi:MAG: hypothetical protein JXR77_14910 [Lentisphaeria bacterium]|nr:hypothetical protein [Lentisphaeria bacterium]
MRSTPAFCTILCCAATAAGGAWEAEEFPIACWRGPGPAHNTLEHYRILKECGFNVVGPTGGHTPETNRVLLECCARVGLKAILTDPRIAPEMVLRNDWQKLVADIVADYAASPALYGYYLRDEPSSLLFEPLGLISREFEAQDPAHLPYINLFPTYASTGQLGTPTYADHLERFVRTTQPRLISYDHYALLKAGGFRPDYYENMELVLGISLAGGIPWWYVHNSGAYSGYRSPTEAEMRWQLYTSLAYGAKGISYWYYWGRQQEHDERTGVVDAEGRPTWLYGILKALNRETQVLGRILLPLTCTGVYHVGEIPAGTRRLGTDAILQLPPQSSLMVAFFDSPAAQPYAMVVNRDCTEPCGDELALLPHVVRVESISPRDGSAAELAIDNGRVRLDVPPGGGVLLRLSTAFDYPKPPDTRTAIAFHFDGNGDMEGWDGLSGLDNPVVAGGTLTMALGARDPHLQRTYLRIPPDTHRSLRLRMRVTSGAPMAQVFWTTSEEPAFADTRYMNFEITPDGQWHEYEIPLHQHPRWAGKEIRGIRLDPSTGGAEPGARVEIDWIVGLPPQ